MAVFIEKIQTRNVSYSKCKKKEPVIENIEMNDCSYGFLDRKYWNTVLMENQTGFLFQWLVQEPVLMKNLKISIGFL